MTRLWRTLEEAVTLHGAEDDWRRWLGTEFEPLRQFLRATNRTVIGKEGGDRVVRAYGCPTCVAKNRYGITEELPLSWPAFMAAMSAG